MRIPRVFHQIWLGPDQMPAEYKEFQAGWLEKHPGWGLRLWTDENMPRLINQAAFDRSISHAAKANILRYEVLLRHGGIYIDTDFECLHNLEALVSHIDCFAARQRDGVVNNAILGAVPGHPFLHELVYELEERARTVPDKIPSVTQSGPYYLHGVVDRHPDVTIFGADLFYPYEWHERWRRGERFPDAYAVHHWTLSARSAERASPRALGDDARPCLHVIVRASPRSRLQALEWALEGLCNQTVGDFCVSVAEQANGPEIVRLVDGFKDRLAIALVGDRARDAGKETRWNGWGYRDVRGCDRVLFLDGDCVPDPDVVEAHVAYRSYGVVPFGFRRLYPESKLYSFRPPLDYPGLEHHARPDPRATHPFQPFYGDWRDVHPSNFSVPTAALGPAGADHLRWTSALQARRLIRDVWQRKFRLVPLLGQGRVTHVLAPDEPPGPGGAVFRTESSIHMLAGSYSSGGGQPPTTIEVVTDAKNQHAVDGSSPVAAFVRFALWDHAYDASGEVHNAVGEEANFVGTDTHRFYFRVKDPSATAASISVNWRSLKADGTDDDRPASQALTLARTAPGSGIYVSKAVMVVTDDTDAEFHTDSGLQAGDPDAGLRARGASNHRTRRADMAGAIRGEYQPVAAGPPVTVTVPVFQRQPDERRRVQLRLINYGSHATAEYVQTQVAHANNRWNQVAVRIEAGALTPREIPPGVLNGAGQFPAGAADNPNEQAALKDLIPITPDNTVSVVFVPLADANAYATVAERKAVALGERFFVFVDTTLAATQETLAHELHHLLFNRFDDTTSRQYFTLNTNAPAGYGVPLPDVRIYRRVQNMNSPNPDEDAESNNITNWARRSRTTRFPIGSPGLAPATPSTGNTLVSPL